MNIINKIIVMTLACTVASFNASFAYYSNDSMGFDSAEASAHNPWRILGRLEEKTENIAISLSEFKAETNEQFKRVDERFDEVNVRFKRVDEQFDEVNVRFKRVDEQFKRVDERFDAMNTSVGAFRAEMMSRFDRLEAMIGGQFVNVEQTHIAYVNKTDLRLQNLEDHWSYRFSNQVIYNPLTYWAIGAAAAGVRLEIQAAAGNQSPHSAYGFYGVSALIADQVLWSVFGPTIPEGITVVAQNSLLALTCLALYRVHLWRERINPFITFASVSGVTTVGAALSQSQNIAKIFAHVFGTAEAPAEKK